ncbi:hypothetical protein GCM10023238_33570 [Streptomyces heliomycini]
MYVDWTVRKRGSPSTVDGEGGADGVGLGGAAGGEADGEAPARRLREPGVQLLVGEGGLSGVTEWIW